MSRLIDPLFSKRYKLECVPIKDSDQPVHQSSLIRVFTKHTMGSEHTMGSVCPNDSSYGQQKVLSGYIGRLGRCAMLHILGRQIFGIIALDQLFQQNVFLHRMSLSTMCHNWWIGFSKKSGGSNNTVQQQISRFFLFIVHIQICWNLLDE